MGKRLLIVEDAALVALDLAAQAEDAGWDVVGPASSVAEALALANSCDLQAALLDVRLGDELITPVAELLRAQGVTIVFGSGLDAAAYLPRTVSGAPCLDKPFTFAEVETALSSARSL